MAWQNSKKITGLWAINEPNNAWAWVDGIGWRKCDDKDNTTNILILCAHAKAIGGFVDFNEETRDNRTRIVEIYAW